MFSRTVNQHREERASDADVPKMQSFREVHLILAGSMVMAATDRSSSLTVEEPGNPAQCLSYI